MEENSKRFKRFSYFASSGIRFFALHIITKLDMQNIAIYYGK